jgi:phenylpropionate dioxygenase-like ring-hydroxylating dioxygenase large terminal subunit
MVASPVISVAHRLLANVNGEAGDAAADMMTIPTAHFRDPQMHARELEGVFRTSPLLVALSCDLATPGDYSAIDIAGRPLVIVRGDDGVARVFLNICRHRAAKVTESDFGHARRLTCPYHFWVYDTQGSLVGTTARGAIDLDVEGLVELPSAERSGAIFAVLTPGLSFDIDDWLGDMASALSMLELETLVRHRDGAVCESGSWKATADGYVDGYHLGYLHRNSIGAKSITNRNTYDLYGPHVRIGFANKPIVGMSDLPDEQWRFPEAMSLVHFVFPNVSFSGLPGGGVMFSRIYPGPLHDRCTVAQFQYFREPMTSAEQIAQADTKRELYLAVTRDEDFATVIQITDAMGAIPNDVIRYGRNEPGNQNLHRWITKLREGIAQP